MDFNIACGTWIKAEDEKILTVLKNSDRWLSAQELCEITGLPLLRVRRTLSALISQMDMYESRKRFCKDVLDKD